MATDFNINDFLGGGSSSNFGGNFDATSTRADLFSPTTPAFNPANLFDFEKSYLNNNQINLFDPSAPFASPFPDRGYTEQYEDNVLGNEQIRLTQQRAGDTLSALQQYGGSASGGNNFGPTNFSALDTALKTAEDRAFNTYDSNIVKAGMGNFGMFAFPAGSPNRPSYTESIGELLGNMREYQEKNFDPIISSVPAPGLDSFSRFNPTTQQFEEMFGNRAAQLPSADVFVKGETGFNDGARFLESIRNQAQQNADNFTGVLSPEKLQQAQELGQLMGTGDPTQVMNIGNPNPGSNSVQYGQPSAPVSAEDLNKLLNMRNNQQQALQRTADNQYVRGEDFQKAMTEMNKPFVQSQAAFDRASDLRTQALENRIPFNATFNYDKQGNKVLAGDSARAAAAGANTNELSMAEYRAKAQAMYPGKGSRRLKGKDLDNAARALRDADRREKSELTQRVSEAVTTVKNLLDTANVDYRAMGFDDDAIAQGVKSMGSPGAFINALASVMASVPPEEAEEFGEVTAATLSDISIKTPKQYMIKETGEVTTLGYGPGGALTRVFPPKFDARGNIVQNRRMEEFGSDEVQLYDTGDFRSDQETLSTLRNEIQGEDTIAIEKLVEFRDLRAQTAQGMDKVIADIGRTFKTIFKEDLSEAEMIEAVASAKFQGLLGSVRLEVLGPGVLTEQDALRLIQSMGGFGFTANRDSAIRILDDIIAKKEKVMGAKINKYNDFRTSNLALRNLRNTKGDIRFEEITFTPRMSLPPL